MGRLKYEKSDKYRREVRLGNWFERYNSYTKDPHDFRTTNMNHYPPKPRSANDPNLIWDQLIKTQGYGARLIFDHQAPHFLENKSTTYDLAYNHIPRANPTGPIHRELRFRMLRYEPQIDFADNYGNITNFGLVGAFKEKWRCEKNNPRTTLTTLYQDTFLPPTKEDLLARHWAVPLPNSSMMDSTNRSGRGLTLRNKQISMVPENELVLYNPIPRRCNPITWECPDKYQEIPNKCVIRHNITKLI